MLTLEPATHQQLELAISKLSLFFVESLVCLFSKDLAPSYYNETFDAAIWMTLVGNYLTSKTRTIFLTVATRFFVFATLRTVASIKLQEANLINNFTVRFT